MQHARGQPAAGVFRDGCEAEMPRFGLYARQYPAKRAEKPESHRIVRQPFGQCGERTARLELLRRELNPKPSRNGVPIDEIDVGAPVVPARSGKGGPQQNRLDALGCVELVRIEGQSCRVNHGPRAAEFLVPDRQLAREIAKTALRHKIEAVGQGPAPKGQEWRGHVIVQSTPRFAAAADVEMALGAKPAGVHDAARPAANSATWSNTRVSVPTS